MAPTSSQWWVIRRVLLQSLNGRVREGGEEHGWGRVAHHTCRHRKLWIRVSIVTQAGRCRRKQIDKRHPYRYRGEANRGCGGCRRQTACRRRISAKEGQVGAPQSIEFWWNNA
ncbi:hypothetical protein B0I35DRAFT_241329 [Stachybotrys elegans]|uniref:Uncharacterized protein n=1 Tax=Stachybotrys elegans TaxID=80388 RepID=A0A8K0SR86_9HYPO|nr:hypothetical protein B0I35DRAFT_241329 [Stachybotrys elegans]